MDYNFNLKHTQRKFRMPPLMQPSNLERCFSTSSGIKMTTCMSNKLTANPLINLISEFHNQIPTMCSISSGGNQMTSSLFSATTSMSVSCSTSSFVGGGGVNKTPKTPTYCDELILDALLNSHLPYENTQKTTAAKGSDLTNINAQRTRRRTYAEVTKEKPKPRGLVNCVTTGVQSILPTSCDNFTILRHSQSVEFGTMNPNPKQDQVTGITRVCSETMVVPRNAKRLSSSSSESSTEPGKMNGRTFSECSVDSDDSFILFQHDDDGKVCDYSEEESSEDDDESEEVIRTAPCSERLSTSSDETCRNRSPKKVRFKPDSELVKVHKLVTWDYALRASRIGPWEQYARDRDRFNKRIKELSLVISPVLATGHRQAVFRERFLSQKDLN